MNEEQRVVKGVNEVLSHVLAGQRKGQLKEQLGSLNAEELQATGAAIQARTEMERQVVQERAGNVIPGAWPVKKRLSVMKYVRKCVEPLDIGSLNGLDSEALSQLVEDAGLGYDAYLLRRMNGLKVKPKKQS